MSTSRIAVAVLGVGRVAELVAQRIMKRPDLELVGVSASSEPAPAGSACVVYLPTGAELAGGGARERVLALLREGFDVVSTAPADALAPADLLAACREGGTTFHGTGGFQSSLITHFNRAFAAIARDIRAVELIEERAVEDQAWGTERAAEVASYYDEGLRTLSDAVFGDAARDTPVTASTTLARDEGPVGALHAAVEEPHERLVVRRSLGKRVAYHSVWTRRDHETTPLRYQLSTRSDDALGRVALTFHADGSLRPSEHLSAISLLEAIRPVHDAAPGVLRYELDIHQVKPDERLAR